MANLGDLSARFESNGDPGAIGFDSVGGFSYGMYQIAAKVGTMDVFLTSLSKTNPHESGILQAAGGAAAARNGTPAFKAAWKQLASTEHDHFAQIQHDFIKATLYDPQVTKLKANFDLDINAHSAALRDVVWSMAVQMGNLTQTVFKNALQGETVNGLSEKDLITQLYAERSNLDRYFSHSTPQVKQSLLDRFKEECAKALAMLGNEAA